MQLQREGAELCGSTHPSFSNRTAGGEGQVRGAQYYVLYVVLDYSGDRQA